MGEWLTFTFALTGRREWGHGTQGVALGYGLAGLSARAGPQTGLFPHNLHLLNFLDFEHPNLAGALPHQFYRCLSASSRSMSSSVQPICSSKTR